MKKIAKSFLAIVAVVVLAVTFAGCASSVKGNTYTLTEVTAIYPKDASNIEKGLMDAGAIVVETTLKGAPLTFGEDGKIGLSEWKQSGSKVTVTTGSIEVVYTVKGNKLTRKYTNDAGYNYNVTYEKK